MKQSVVSWLVTSTNFWAPCVRMVITWFSEQMVSRVVALVAHVVSVPLPPGFPTTLAHTVYAGAPPVVLVGGSWNEADPSVHALLSRTLKVVPWLRKMSLSP